MGSRFAELVFTPSVKVEQERGGSRSAYARLERSPGGRRDHLGPEEIAFVQRRDSFYVATVSETGWPYVQHRGGSPGFVRVLDATLIGILDFPGNRQFVTLGNLAANDRVALIFMDYPERRRLKVLGHARSVDGARETALLDRLRDAPSKESGLSSGLVIQVAAFDWNCPQYITPRYTAAEIQVMTGALRSRLQETEAELATLRRQLRQARP